MFISACAGTEEKRARARAFSAHARNRRCKRLLHYARHHFRRRDGRGGVCAHSTRVGPGVAFADALVVLCGREGYNGVAVGEGEDRDFRSSEEFFYDNLATCLQKL